MRTKTFAYLTGLMLAAILAGACARSPYEPRELDASLSYIGETEKNLARALDRAEDHDGVLLLDEGDALLGKRTSVQDGHDRYR